MLPLSGPALGRLLVPVRRLGRRLGRWLGPGWALVVVVVVFVFFCVCSCVSCVYARGVVWWRNGMVRYGTA